MFNEHNKLAPQLLLDVIFHYNNMSGLFAKTRSTPEQFLNDFTGIQLQQLYCCTNKWIEDDVDLMSELEDIIQLWHGKMKSTISSGTEL